MESVYHFVTIRVNETSWAHVWRLRSRYLRMGYDKIATAAMAAATMARTATGGGGGGRGGSSG
jgi:uncharacterized membrane protein